MQRATRSLLQWSRKRMLAPWICDWWKGKSIDLYDEKAGSIAVAYVWMWEWEKVAVLGKLEQWGESGCSFIETWKTKERAIWKGRWISILVMICFSCLPDTVRKCLAGNYIVSLEFWGVVWVEDRSIKPLYVVWGMVWGHFFSFYRCLIVPVPFTEITTLCSLNFLDTFVEN